MMVELLLHLTLRLKKILSTFYRFIFTLVKQQLKYI